MKLARYLLPALFAAFLAACGSIPAERDGGVAPLRPAPGAVPGSAPASVKRGGGYYQDDGPGEQVPVDLAGIPDAVPRKESIKAATTRPYEVLGQTFKPLREVSPFTQQGVGSWYGRKFHGAKTSSGEAYDMYGMTAAHPTLPIPSYARVTNLENGRQVVVRVNDRGPFLHKRIIDLSYTAAWKLGYVNKGSARLQVDAITLDEIDSGSYALAAAPAAGDAPPAPAGAGPSQPPRSVPDPLEALIEARSPAIDAAPAAAMPRAALQPLDAGTIFLQLGAFGSSTNAESFRDYVRTELDWLQQEVRTQLIGDKYRLRVGPFRDAAEARSIAERIASAIGTRPFIVQ